MDPLMKHEHSQDGIMVWIDLLNTCNKGGNKDIRIEELEDIITTPCNRNAPGGLQEFLNNHKTASTELAFVLEAKEWQDEDTHKRMLIKNLESLGCIWLDMVAETKSLNELYEILRKLALKRDCAAKKRHRKTNQIAMAQLAHVE